MLNANYKKYYELKMKSNVGTLISKCFLWITILEAYCTGQEINGTDMFSMRMIIKNWKTYSKSTISSQCDVGISDVSRVSFTSARPQISSFQCEYICCSSCSGDILALLSDITHPAVGNNRSTIFDVGDNKVIFMYPCPSLVVSRFFSLPLYRQMKYIHILKT